MKRSGIRIGWGEALPDVFTEGEGGDIFVRSQLEESSRLLYTAFTDCRQEFEDGKCTQILKPHLCTWWTAAERKLLNSCFSCFSCLKALPAKQEPASVSWPALLPSGVNCAKLLQQRFLKHLTQSLSKLLPPLFLYWPLHQQSIRISISPWVPAGVGGGKIGGKSCPPPDPTLSV